MQSDVTVILFLVLNALFCNTTPQVVVWVMSHSRDSDGGVGQVGNILPSQVLERLTVLLPTQPKAVFVSTCYSNHWLIARTALPAAAGTVLPAVIASCEPQQRCLDWDFEAQVVSYTLSLGGQVSELLHLSYT